MLVARSLGLDALGTFATVLLFVTFVNLSQLSKEGPTPEKQLLLPMTIAYLTAIRGHWTLAGISAAIAFTFKQTAVSIPLALAVWLVWDNRSMLLRRLGGFAIGYIPILVAVVVYFASRGALGAFWEAAFGYNVNQATTNPLRIPYGLLAGSWHVFSNSSAVLWLAGLGGLLLVVKTARLRLLAFWALADAISLCLGGFKFAQVAYVQVVPSLAILGGLAFGFGWQATRDLRTVRVYAAIVVAAIFLLSNQFQAGVTLRAWNERTPGRSSMPFEQILASKFNPDQRGGPDQPLFVWGDNSEIYLYANARASGRFFQVLSLTGVYAGRGFQQRRTELLRAWENAPPAIIAIDPATIRDDPDGSLGLNPGSFPEMEALIRERYTPMENIGQGWQAFRRN
jgi:hypothetical protein